MTCRTTTEDWATTLTAAAHPLGITREDFTKLLEPFHLRTHDPHHEPRGHCPRDRIISTVTAATGAQPRTGMLPTWPKRVTLTSAGAQAGSICISSAL